MGEHIHHADLSLACVAGFEMIMEQSCFDLLRADPTAYSALHCHDDLARQWDHTAYRSVCR